MKQNTEIISSFKNIFVGLRVVWFLLNTAASAPLCNHANCLRCFLSSTCVHCMHQCTTKCKQSRCVTSQSPVVCIQNSSCSAHLLGHTVQHWQMLVSLPHWMGQDVATCLGNQILSFACQNHARTNWNFHWNTGNSSKCHCFCQNKKNPWIWWHHRCGQHSQDSWHHQLLETLMLSRQWLWGGHSVTVP